MKAAAMKYNASKEAAMRGSESGYRYPAWVRYGVAVAATAVTLPVSSWLARWAGHDVPMVLFALPVMVSAYVGGLGPGLLATGLSAAVAGYAILEPYLSLEIARYPDRLRLLLVAVVGGLISLLSEGLHRARRRSELNAAALTRSRQQIGEILSSITDAYFALDNQWRIVAMNERAAKYFGVPLEQVRGREFWEVCPQCRESQLDWRLRQVRAGGNPEHFELPSCAFAGRWAEIHAYPSEEGLSVYFREISDRKQAEEMLRRSQERLQAALWASGTGTFRWEFGGKAMEWDENMDRLLGIPGPWAVRELGSWLEVVHADDRGRVAEQFRRCAAQGMDLNVEYRVLRPEGSERWLASKGKVFSDPAGRPQYMTGATTDVTSMKRIEQDLRVSEDRMRLAMEAAEIGVWQWDLMKDDLAVSSQCQALLGLAKGEQIRFGEYLEQVHPEDRSKVQQAMAQALAERRDFSSEYRVSGPGGKEHWMLVKGRALYDEQGRAVRMHGVVIDITQRKRMEQDLELAKEAAEGANRAKDQFLAALSHELRTPLTPVLMSAEALAADASLPPPVRGEMEMIGRNVEVEKRLIDDLLDLTRIARGKLQLHPGTTDVHEVIRHALEAVREEVRGKGLQLALELRAAERFVWGDGARLQQVVWNLLKNAVKFTPAGGAVVVRTANGSRPGQERPTVSIAVSDTGMGIEPALLPRLFEAFEQGGTEMTQRFGGLGLGLAISKALVELHEGTIQAFSEGRGRGATFTVELPTVVAPALPAPTAPIRTPKAGRHLKILLVEDHASTAQVLARLLRMLEHEVEIADSVGSALSLAAAKHFDLIISDLGLPDGSGLDLMRQIQGTWHTPGIALSGYGMEEDLKRSREAGFTEHLVKPVNMKALEQAIVRLAGDGDVGR